MEAEWIHDNWLQVILASYTVDEGRIVLQSVVIDSTTYYVYVHYIILLLSAAWGCRPRVHAHEALKSLLNILNVLNILNILNMWNILNILNILNMPACQDLFAI